MKVYQQMSAVIAKKQFVTCKKQRPRLGPNIEAIFSDRKQLLEFGKIHVSKVAHFSGDRQFVSGCFFYFCPVD